MSALLECPVSIPAEAAERAEQRLRIRKLEAEVASLRGMAARDLLAMRIDIGQMCVAEILENDPEATEGFASFEREDWDTVPCCKWTVSDKRDRDWMIELRVEPARTGRVGREYPAQLAYWCELVNQGC